MSKIDIVIYPIFFFYIKIITLNDKIFLLILTNCKSNNNDHKISIREIRSILILRRIRPRPKRIKFRSKLYPNTL